MPKAQRHPPSEELEEETAWPKVAILRKGNSLPELLRWLAWEIESGDLVPDNMFGRVDYFVGQDMVAIRVLVDTEWAQDQPGKLARPEGWLEAGGEEEAE